VREKAPSLVNRQRTQSSLEAEDRKKAYGLEKPNIQK